MENYFTISELCIDKDMDVPQDIADKILVHHIIPMNPVREKVGAPITASQNSGWRPEEWEKARGRSGKSQHCFIELGAVDWTSDDLKALLDAIIELTPYTRIAVYPTDEGHFIHCDYKESDHRLFLSNSRSQWSRVSYEQIINRIS